MFFSITLVCLTLVGCDIFAWKMYRNREYKVSFLLPRGWDIDEDTQDAALVIFIPQDNPQAEIFQDNIRMVVQDLPAEIPLSTFYDLNREEILSTFPKHMNIVEGQGMSRLVRYQWLSFDAKLTEGVDIRAINAVWIKGKRVYLLTCVMNLKKAAKIEPLFRKIITSLRF